MNYDKYWQTWSNAVEQGRLRFRGHKGNIKTDLIGRGATQILKKKLGRDRQNVEEEDFKHLRKEWSYKANANLK